MGSAIIPLSIDDENHSIRACSISCMSIPWLVSIGFVIAFSALFSKTWRINKIHHNAQHFRRVQVTWKDVLVPFAVLLTLNVIVLTCWTVIAPLQYERRASPGTDEWNRVSRSYYGACYGPDDVKGGAIPYVVLLTVINFSVIVIANVQAYKARKIKTEFSESRYIALIMLSMLQCWLIGLPILALLRDEPVASYFVFVLILFATCMSTLLFLFIPKLMKTAEEPNQRGSTSTTRQGTSVSTAKQPVASRAYSDERSESEPFANNDTTTVPVDSNGSSATSNAAPPTPSIAAIRLRAAALDRCEGTHTPIDSDDVLLTNDEVVTIDESVPQASIRKE